MQYKAPSSPLKNHQAGLKLEQLFVKEKKEIKHLNNAINHVLKIHLSALPEVQDELIP